MVDLQEQGDAAVAEAVESPELPEGPGAIERPPEDLADEAIQLAVVAGRIGGRVAQVRVDVELGRVRPLRPVEASRHLDDPAAEQSELREALADEAAELLRPERGPRVGVEHREHPDVHVPFRRLRRDEAAVGPAETLDRTRAECRTHGRHPQLIPTGPATTPWGSTGSTIGSARASDRRVPVQARSGGMLHHLTLRQSESSD